MIKLIGSSLFILGGFLLGRAIDSQYKKRVEYWQEVISFLTYCQSEINYNGTDINSIFLQYAKKNGTYSRIISQTLQYNTNVTDESGFLADFAKEISSIDFETQKKAFDIYLQKASEKLSAAKTERINKGKTYIKLLPVLCAGIAIVIW